MVLQALEQVRSKEERESHGRNLHGLKTSLPIHCGDGRLVLVVFLLLPVVVHSALDCSLLRIPSHSDTFLHPAN